VFPWGCLSFRRALALPALNRAVMLKERLADFHEEQGRGESFDELMPAEKK
jgi:hypothetical protein